MKYDDLSRIQKRCIDEFIKLRPELKSRSTITRLEIEELFHTLYEQRNSGGLKIGYPAWIIRNDKVGRGIYNFPAPNIGFDKSDLTISAVEEDQMFFAELAEYGLLQNV